MVANVQDEMGGGGRDVCGGTLIIGRREWQGVFGKRRFEMKITIDDCDDILIELTKWADKNNCEVHLEVSVLVVNKNLSPKEIEQCQP